ncbi:hypothetical protein SARC_05589 [Sphaeroforma arctica JP610]|uniref:EF-hand domain-containing protein n=1 Tax=Sphaeroforma arctica JP610 TaxID=667725 RepID=A0A0L0FZ79_9EUKA|nr:hypothetical protein SARC_05589 [Sphaeroforma arctica JP610]KNC82120.1 hypothetical protein SARC_05589 [Sphaeroforma arctica JP610]|eukprot:XP_014156022.1 hypothetical protein SARC_05589 [Sphaeroforma arctica JP610]
MPINLEEEMKGKAPSADKSQEEEPKDPENQMFDDETLNGLGDTFAEAFEDQLDLGMTDEEQAFVDLLVDFDADFLTKRATEVLTEVFNRFDEDKDGFLSDKEMDAFAEVCNGEKFEDEDRDDIKNTFGSENGKFTLEGFHNLFMLQSCGRPLDTIRDLKALGYGPGLEKLSSE